MLGLAAADFSLAQLAMREVNRMMRTSPVLFVFFLAACIKNGADGDSPVGRWTASDTVRNEEGVFLANVRYEIALNRGQTSEMELFWNERFAKGFIGRWELRGDSLDLLAEKCFKGDSLGTKYENSCDEDLPTRKLTLEWNGKNLRGFDGRVTFSRR